MGSDTQIYPRYVVLEGAHIAVATEATHSIFNPCVLAEVTANICCRSTNVLLYTTQAAQLAAKTS